MPAEYIFREGSQMHGIQKAAPVSEVIHQTPLSVAYLLTKNKFLQAHHSNHINHTHNKYMISWH